MIEKRKEGSYMSFAEFTSIVLKFFTVTAFYSIVWGLMRKVVFGIHSAVTNGDLYI